MNIRTAAILIIGDEILSGRTQDTNVRTIAHFLNDLGIDLKEVRIVPDQKEEIIEAVNVLRHKYSYLFTTGGIGSTHDDITIPCIAEAFDTPLVMNEEATKIIQEHYGDHLNDIRLSMAYMPANALLIHNPVSKVPSFYIENVFVLAGMPSVMKGMLEFVKSCLESGPKVFVNTLTSSVVEGVLAKELESIQQQYSDVTIGSYPFYNYPDIGTSIVLRSRNVDALVDASKKVYQMQIDFGGHPKLDLEVPF